MRAGATPATAPGRPAGVEEGTVERLHALRARSGTDLEGARDAAWAWLAELGRLALNRRSDGCEALEAVFRNGLVPGPIEGRMEGAVLTTLTVPLLDRAVTATAVRLRPWMGKRFAAGGTAGHNLLRPWAGRTLRLAWPRYRPTREGQAIAAFRFETRIERSVEAPEAEVMVLDYAVASNPRLVIRGIRDELVEVVPGVCLGKAYRLDRRGRHLLAGYFALRPDRR